MSETVITDIVGTFLIKFNGNKHNGKKYTIEPVVKLSVTFVQQQGVFSLDERGFKNCCLLQEPGACTLYAAMGNSRWQLPMLIEMI